MANKIEIEVAKIYDGITYYNCTAYDYNGEVVGFMKEMLPVNVKRFVEAFTYIENSEENE